MRYAKQNRLRAAAVGLVVAVILVGGTGLSCDQNAQTDFRSTATQAIGDGVKTIITGLIDGVVAAVQNAGDSSSSTSNNSSSSSSSSTST